MNSHVTVVEFVLMGISIFFVGLSIHLQGRVERRLKYVNRILQSEVDRLDRLNTRQVYGKAAERVTVVYEEGVSRR